jgi:demethylmenaquinone methyltransferase / 2-methoxy-6-polyprenyl-1,4-benzoquinol methylase
MASHIGALPWTSMIDVAAGTGDISLRVARMTPLSAQRRCLVTDICPQMLDIARRKARGTLLSFEVMDAHTLDGVASESVDLYASSLGMKICDRRRAIEQALRVLKPGGCFICLEASRIRVPIMQALYLQYMRACMPALGWLATGGDASAYRYLLKGIDDFPGAEMFADELGQAGFEDVRFELFSLGIVAIHQGRKPHAGNGR